MLVCFALFDDEVSFDEKKYMVKAMDAGHNGKSPTKGCNRQNSSWSSAKGFGFCEITQVF